MVKMVSSTTKQPPHSSVQAGHPVLVINDFRDAVPARHRYDTGLIDILAGKPHPIWGTHRLWSLWDMINCSVSDFVWALKLISQELLVARNRTRSTPDQPISTEDRKRFEPNFQFIARQCDRLNLSNTDNRLGRIGTRMRSTGGISYADLTQELETLLEAIEDDLKTEYFYHYRHQRGLMLMQLPVDWGGTLRRFPATAEEINDAVDCFASEHYTASVFHLMRIAEYGLRALARERQVVIPGRPLEWAMWGQLIDQITASVRGLNQSMSAGPQKDAALAFYNGALAHIHAFKDKYRNVTMHVRGRYGEMETLTALDHVREFMNGLSAKIGETTRRPIRRWP